MKSEVPSVDQMAHEVYSEFAYKMKHVVVENPICQKCGNGPSVAINRWGTILACCRACLIQELADFEEFCKEQEKLYAEEDW